MVVLPRPPSNAEKYAYRDSGRVFVYAPSAFAACLLIMGAWLFVFADPAFYVYAVFALVMTANLLLSYALGILGRDFSFSEHIAKVSRPREEQMVDIYLPVCGEPFEVLKNTWRHVYKLNWEKKIVYVLDDKGDKRLELLADDHNFIYISRPNKGELKKAGNLRHAFRLTSAPFFVVFDADFCPHPDFLKETIPYFDNPDVAIVQTPQYFTLSDSQTWVEKGAAYVQEFFYRLVQVSRDHFKAPICVGTNAVYRRRALEPFGGTAPIGYSEDVHTGFMVSNSGWFVKYVPVCLARGICPHDVESFFIQQYRWALGSLTLFGNKRFWTSNLFFTQKLCYLTGMLYYITTGLSVILAPIPAMALIWTRPDLVFWYNYIFSIPSFLIGVMLMPLWHTQPFGWYAFRARIVSYYAHLFAMKDKLTGNLMSWRPTGSTGKVERFDKFKSLLFYWTMFSLLVVVVGVSQQLDRFTDFLPTTFFSLFNSWVALTILKDQ